MPSIKQVLPTEKSKRSTDSFVRTPSHSPCLQGIVCYTFQVYCRAVMSLPCVKGGGSRKRDGGIVKSKIIPKNNPSAAFGVSSLYTREPFFMFIYCLSIFLTSTAFVGTNATKVICFAFAQRDITRLTRSDIVPDGRSDIIFALKINAQSAYHVRRTYHALVHITRQRRI